MNRNFVYNFKHCFLWGFHLEKHMALVFRNSQDGGYTTAMKRQQNKMIASRRSSTGKDRLNIKFLKNTFDTSLLTFKYPS